MSRWRWPRLGLRREVLLLVPMAMLALVLLSTFSIVAYRHSLGEWLRQRQTEAEMLARETAIALAEAPSLSPTLLRRLAPGARRVAVVDDRGQVVTASEPFDSPDLLAPLAGRPTQATAVGPGPGLPDTTAGFAPLIRGGRELVVRIDLPADLLAGQLRGLRILYWVALPINFLVVGLVFLFMRYLLRPIDTLLEQARRVDEDHPSSDDEIAFLLATFERAVNALTGRDTSVDDEIRTLQRALAPSLESGLLLLDRQAAVLALNSAGCELLDVDAPVVGTPIEEALPNHSVLLEILRTAVDSGRGVARQEVPIRSGDEQKTLGLTVHSLRRDDGSTRGFLVLFVDLTEVRRKASEESLAKGLAQLGELAAGVAHELRNSLATLRGYLTLAERRSGAEGIDEYLAEMRRESDQLARVVEDFLTFARPEAAQVEDVDLVALVHRAAADPALGRDAVVVDAGELRTASVAGDPQLLERAVKNLLRNAAQAAPADGAGSRVVCRLRRRDGNLQLAIEDRGPGLPASVRESLFQPFVTTRPGGVGLGLSLAHRIIDLHGGVLLLEDRRGGGTRALITLPAGVSVT